MLLSLLAQAPDFDSPYTSYFSFIVLGLVLTVGYAWFRLARTKAQREALDLEEQLLEAEREARRLHAQRLQSQQGTSGLELTPDQILERAQLQKLAGSAPPVDGAPPSSQHTQHSNNDPAKMD